jgi:acid phosphatase
MPANRRTAFALIVLALGLSDCGASRSVPTLYDTQSGIDRYVSSGQYEREFAAVVQSARDYLEKRAKVVTKPAIVLDIDETSLSNWPAYRANGWSRITGGPCDLERGPCGSGRGRRRERPKRCRQRSVWRSAPRSWASRFFHHRPAARSS